MWRKKENSRNKKQKIFPVNEKTYVKKCKKREVDFYLKANEKKICPKIIQHKISNTENFIEMEKYCCTLGEMRPESKRLFYIEIENLLKKLHEIGILWIDIHDQNIVLNSSSDIRLIDFGHSITKDEWTPETTVNWFDEIALTVEDHEKIEIETLKNICFYD